MGTSLHPHRATSVAVDDHLLMRLHPNPPRMVTVALAVALAVVGVILAWPVEPALALLAPVGDIAQSFGLAMDAQTGYLCLFASSALLVAGSLLPGI